MPENLDPVKLVGLATSILRNFGSPADVDNILVGRVEALEVRISDLPQYREFMMPAHLRKVLQDIAELEGANTVINLSF